MAARLASSFVPPRRSGTRWSTSVEGTVCPPLQTPQAGSLHSHTGWRRRNHARRRCQLTPYPRACREARGSRPWVELPAACAAQKPRSTISGHPRCRHARLISGIVAVRSPGQGQGKQKSQPGSPLALDGLHHSTAISAENGGIRGFPGFSGSVSVYLWVQWHGGGFSCPLSQPQPPPDLLDDRVPPLATRLLVRPDGRAHRHPRHTLVTLPVIDLDQLAVGPVEPV